MIEKELEGFRKLDPGEKIKSAAAYLIESSDSGEFYVGSTGHLVNRLKSHTSNLARNKHPNFGLQKIFNEKERSNLTVYIKETKDREEALDIEQLLLDRFKGTPKILNVAFDARRGGAGRPMTESNRAKLSVAVKGKKKPEGFSEKLSKANKEHPRREELNKALSENRMSGNNPNAKLVLCYGIVYGSGSEAARALGISRSVMDRKLKNGKGADPFCQKLTD